MKPTDPQRNKRSRVRYDSMISSTMNEARYQETHKPIQLPSRLKVSIAIFVLLAGVVYFAARWLSSDTFMIKTIRVVNNRNVPAEDVIKASELQGKHIYSVLLQPSKLDQSVERIKTVAGVDGARVECASSPQVECALIVQPAQPLAILQTKQGAIWLDRQARAQKVSEEISPLIKLKQEPGTPPLSQTYVMTQSLVRALTELETLDTGVGEYYFSEQYGLSFDQRGARVRIGVAETEGAMRLKLELAKQLRVQLESKNVAPKMIDVRFVERPYYTTTVPKP